MIELYHGSNAIVEKPLVNVGRKELDFGPGFYVTRHKEQAERWAKRVSTIRRAKTPYLSTFIFDDDKLPADCRMKILPDYDNDWLNFIVASRTGQKPWFDYDIIEGGVANDQVIDTVEDYFSGRITAEQAIGQLKFAHPSHQICIRRQNIVDNFLHYQGTVIVK